MTPTTTTVIQSIPDTKLAAFAVQLNAWLLADLHVDDGFSESRTRALLLSANTTDDATLHDFERLTTTAQGIRLALFDLLQSTGLAEVEAVQALTAVPTPTTDAINWLTLALAAYAWKAGYPLTQLDPASPPESFSPAGQVVHNTAAFLRRQIQRSATERDKLAHKIGYRGDDAPPTLDSLATDQPIAPVPPHYRPPIPVRYPEYARETVQVDEADDQPATTAVSRGNPITITSDEIAEPDSQPTRMPAIKIDKDDIRPERQTPPPPRNVVTTPPPITNASRSGFTDAVRSMLGRDKEPLTTTKLRVIVQEHPDGPGLYGLQVQVRCKGINSFVAGTTNRDGHFLCELPVRVNTGLTYDVDVTWPRDFNSEVERKAITLNADRTEFTLPFYMQHSKDNA